jgi:hypothetical protein
MTYSIICNLRMACYEIVAHSDGHIEEPSSDSKVMSVRVYTKMTDFKIVFSF